MKTETEYIGKTEATRTPGEWWGVNFRGEVVLINAPNAGQVCVLEPHPRISMDECIANGQIIVRACNCYDELLNAAKILASLQHADGGRAFPTVEDIAFAKAAIARAEKEVPF